MTLWRPDRSPSLNVINSLLFAALRPEMSVFVGFSALRYKIIFCTLFTSIDWYFILVLYSFPCSFRGLLLLHDFTTSLSSSHSFIYRLQDYDATCRLAQEIAENIHERNRQQRTGGNPAKVNFSVTCELEFSAHFSRSCREFLVFFC